MASAKFTKGQIDVISQVIESYAKEMREALNEEDVSESFSRVDILSSRIKMELDTIHFRLMNCDEY